MSQELIQELQTILLEDYEQDLSISETSKIANNMVNYYGLLGEIADR